MSALAFEVLDLNWPLLFTTLISLRVLAAKGFY